MKGQFFNLMKRSLFLSDVLPRTKYKLEWNLVKFIRNKHERNTQDIKEEITDHLIEQE